MNWCTVTKAIHSACVLNIVGPMEKGQRPLLSLCEQCKFMKLMYWWRPIDYHSLDSWMDFSAYSNQSNWSRNEQRKMNRAINIMSSFFTKRWFIDTFLLRNFVATIIKMVQVSTEELENGHFSGMWIEGFTYGINISNFILKAYEFFHASMQW